MKARDFEKTVWEIEKVRIVIHAANSADFKEYGKTNAADEKWSIKELGDERIAQCLGDTTYTVIQGNGEKPNGRTILRTIRGSYEK